MALTDEVQGRYSSQVLINASNPQDSNATTLDTTRLNYAITDVQAQFEMNGLTYDNDIPRHVTVAVQGVFARLLMLTGQGGDAEWGDFRDQLTLLRESTSRDRISPTTDSLLTPTKDDSGDLPATDRKQFQGYIPSAPSEPATGS